MERTNSIEVCLRSGLSGEPRHAETAHVHRSGGRGVRAARRVNHVCVGTVNVEAGESEAKPVKSR